MPSKVEGLVTALKKYRINYASESELQQGVAGVFEKEGYAFEREVFLSPGDRIDFIVGDIGIEVKTGGSLSALLRQLYRYAKYDSIKCLLVITSRNWLTQLPEKVREKPIQIINLGNAF